MKILTLRSRSKKRKAILLASILVVICIALICVYYFLNNTSSQTVNNNSNTDSESFIDYSKPTEEQKSEGEEIKLNADTDQTKDQPESAGSEKTIINMSIPTANINSSILQIRTQIDTLTNSGECNLLMTGPNNEQIVKTSELQSLASNSTCKGFDIKVSDLSVGDWQVTITFSNSTMSGSATRSVRIQ